MSYAEACAERLASTIEQHFARMIRNAENDRMKAFLTDLLSKLADPNHVPTGKWNQRGPWGLSDFSIVPAWIRLDFYDESRVLESMSWKQKLQWWKIKEQSRKKALWVQERRRNPSRNHKNKQGKILKALTNGDWISVERLMQIVRCRSAKAIQNHINRLRAIGHVIRCRVHHQRGPCEYQLAVDYHGNRQHGSGAGSHNHQLTDTFQCQVLAALESREWITRESLMMLCGGVGPETIRRAVYDLRKRGYLILTQREPQTRYQLGTDDTVMAPVPIQAPAVAPPMAEINPVKGKKKEQ